ncbi:MAG: RNA polymerase recycling motor HelD [Lactobacillus sp.]|nr:RNA polymerase recycling motor HelD [Lactobacillus sp.]
MTKQEEQKHLDWILDLLEKRRIFLEKQIKTASSEARHLNSHFFDDVRLDYDNYSTSMETALSIHQQQTLLNERENAWQHSSAQLSTVERLQKKPFFARIDFKEEHGEDETIYIGLSSFAKDEDQFLIYDWRAPISSVYYDGKLGKVSYEAPDGEISVDLKKKRQFMIEDGKIVEMFDTNESIGDQLLLSALSEKSSTEMKSIVTTIQREQNAIIRDTSADLLFVQGAAGSGKTSAILQRIAYLLYRYRGNLTSSDVVMFSPNMIFNDYIKNVLPEMGEQSMVQLTYWQFVARRMPKMKISTIFDQLENQGEKSKITDFKNSMTYFKLVKKYAEHLNKQGLAIRDLIFRDKPMFTKDTIAELYYSYNENYNLANRIEAVRTQLQKMLTSKVTPESKKRWVQDYIETLSKDQLNDLYDHPDQEFKSEEDEMRFLAKKIVIKYLKPLSKRINRYQFVNMRLQYLRFLRAIPQMVDLTKYGIDPDAWQEDIERVKNGLQNSEMSLEDTSSYLYLWDLITGKQMDFQMRYVFVDEIQDYTPFQVAYLKTYFPRAKFTLLGDLNQAIFHHDVKSNLLGQIQSLFDPKKTKVIQLTKSYRSTEQLTNFSKKILLDGEKITPFNRPGRKPIIWNTDQKVATLQKILEHNRQEGLTTAIITKDLATGEALSKKIDATFIRTANQRLVEGNLLLPVYLAKGLEFDAVVMWDATRDNYPDDSYRQIVYTIASRAMRYLDIIYDGEISPLLPTDETLFERK